MTKRSAMEVLLLIPLFVAPAYASSSCMVKECAGLPELFHCERMKATDTLISKGRRQRAEHFVECNVGHWPNVDSVIRRVTR